MKTGLNPLESRLHNSPTPEEVGREEAIIRLCFGPPVSEKLLRLNPPFRIGAAELGNWNASGFPDNDPSLFRDFSGAIDEFCLSSRALNGDEFRALHSAGKPQPIRWRR